MRDARRHAVLLALGLVLLASAEPSAAADRVAGLALAGFGVSVEPISFGLGLLAGVVAHRIWGMPWGRIPELALAMLRTWRRNLGLAALALLCTGVLLFL